MKELALCAEWDKTFPQSDRVRHSKVTFTKRYGITLAADMYVPVDAAGSLPAINASEAIPFIDFPLMSRADEIESAVLIIHGEKAHSRYFGEDAFKKLKGDNKELMIIPGASHTDLYDNRDAIPFDRIAAFFRKNLS